VTVTIADTGPMIHATVSLPGCPRQRALAAFTDPAVLARWWGGELSTDLTVGGPYHVRFPQLGQTMTGQVTQYEPASRLEFTWAWSGADDEPGDDGEPARTVLVTVTPGQAPDGTELTVAHGPHTASAADRAARAEHREGWEFFLPRLAALLTPPEVSPTER
jgi:uncharacterized protein YndB with AHSA1/START domain